jgi:hypothetical protein
VSREGGQLPLLITHSKAFTPTDKLITPVLLMVGAVIVLPPAIKCHNPIPITGGTAVKMEDGAHIVWEFPALAREGFASTVIITESLLERQVPFCTSH